MSVRILAGVAVGAVLGWLPAVYVYAADAAPTSSWVCRSTNSVREIRIVPTGLQGCRVDYLKDGRTQSLWRASTDRRFCEDRAHRLVTQLDHGTFRCEPSAGAEGPAVNGAAKNSRAAAAIAAAPSATDLTAAQIGAANEWLQRRVQAASGSQPVRSGPEARRFSDDPDFLAAADVDGDGRTDLVLGWGWASFRCDGSYLTVLLNDGGDDGPRYRAAEAELPGNCGAKGWLAAVKEVRAGRILIDLRQRYPGPDHVQRIAASVTHAGRFTFYGLTGAPQSLPDIERSLPLKSE